jgi:hypothetical protein
MVHQQEHPVPGGFQFVSELRNLCDVVRHRNLLAAGAREYGKVTRSCQIRTQKSPRPNLQLDAKQCVLNPDPRPGFQFLKPVCARARFANAFTIDIGQPGWFEFCLYSSRKFSRGYGRRCI